eukprot:m.434534 g.434534  ORF g.434534 m.434534 type:complete len:173 (+) comp17728_c0_seq1:78-596(+)
MTDATSPAKRARDEGIPYKEDAYHNVTPYLTVKGAAKALELYVKAFNATEVMRMPGPGGAVMHAEIQIGDSRVMLSDEFPEMEAYSPEHFGGTASHLMIYTEDCDKMHKQAVEAGCTETRAPKDQFYGDRSSQVKDPFGHKWTLATHIENVSEEEMGKRMEAMGEQSGEKNE